MADEKKSFVLYCAYREQLALLSDAERGRLLMALFDYCENKTLPELQGMPLMAFAFIRAQIDRDSEKYDKIVQTRREAGKKGGRPAKTSENQNETNKANAFFDSETTSAHPPSSDTEGEGEVKRDIQAIRFDEFWAAYPKKVGKGAAAKAWTKCKPNAELHQKILFAIERQKKSEQWKKDNGQYIPNPATWLNQQRWDDELRELGQGGYGYGNEQFAGDNQPSLFKPSGGFRGSED